jgi:hypothetical protein
MSTPSDIINPTPVSRYLASVYRTLAVITRSGAANVDFEDPQVNAMGGQLVTLRSFAPDETDSTKNDGVAISSPPGPSSIKNIAILCSRSRVRKVDAASTTGLENDQKNAAIDEIARSMANYWPRQTEKFLISAIKGCTATGGPLNSTHRTVLGTTSSKKYFNYTALIQGGLVLGDNRSALKIIIIHPKALSDWETDEAGRGNFGMVELDTFLGPLPVKTYRGHMIFETEQVPVDTSGGSGNYRYSTYLAAEGAMTLAIRTNAGPDLASRPLIIQQTIANPPSIQRSETVDFFPHVNGTKWSQSYPTDGPAASDLETGTNWAMADNATVKDVRIAEVVTF